MTTAADLSLPPSTLIRIPQGADWPGRAIPIYDNNGNLRLDLTGCTASGAIRGRPGDDPIYRWSTTPGTGQGPIVLAAGYLTFTVPGAHSLGWSFRMSRWQVDLTDPDAPAGEQTIWSGFGRVELLPSYNQRPDGQGGLGLREDLVIPQGKTWTGPVWALLGQDNTSVDLTGKTVRAQVRASVNDPVVLHEWSTEAGNVLVATATVTVRDEAGVSSDVVTAAVALTVDPTVSAAWLWRVGVYDVEVHNPADPEDVLGVVRPSTVRVEPEVTR